MSAQAVGLNAAKAADPARYAALSHPGDTYSYDMFTQAGRAVRTQAATLLGGLKPQRLIADGESQSASRMVTYIDACTRSPTSSTGSSSTVAVRALPRSQDPLPAVPAPSPAMIRADNPSPVLVLQSETDVNSGARQDNSATFRLWEMAGTSHVDAYNVGSGLVDVGDRAGANAIFEAMRNPPGIGCAFPMNAGPSHVVVDTAMFRLNQWVKRDPPAGGAEAAVASLSPTTYMLDPNGNALGGVRTPHVDAPITRLTGTGQKGVGLLFRLSGTTSPFERGPDRGPLPEPRQVRRRVAAGNRCRGECRVRARS